MDSIKQKLNRIGDILIEMSLLTEEQLQAALKEQRRTHEKLGAVLVRLGHVNEVDIARAISKQTGFPYIPNPAEAVKPGAVRLIPESLARRVLALPLERSDGAITVVMADPLNLVDIDDLGYAANAHVMPAISTREGILDGIDKAYRSVDTVDELIEGIELNHLEVIGGERVDLEGPGGAGVDFEPPIVKLVNLMVLEALRQGASDIHVDPTEKLMRVRYRVDGFLRDIMSPPMKLHKAVCSRIKVLASLNIAEHRIPQDGRTLIRTRAGQEVDLRINVVPTIFGEKINMRLLEQDGSKLDIQRLGMAPDTLAQFDELLRRPNGLILVVGPTGSGKTTTLYSGLKSLNSKTMHIITIEDPVEYRLENVNQIQVNAKTGMTFAAGLRACLRQDPNVILVGEIRDRETAEIAVEAAMTGHLVLSTVHSTDAAHTIARLITLGVNPFIAASGLIGILSTRLVRRLCQRCRRPVKVSAEFSEQLGLDNDTLYKPSGCKDCRQTGYNGRQGIYELLPVIPEVQQLIQTNAPLDKMHAAMAELDIPSLWSDGIEKIVAGETTLEEVMRVTRSYQLTGQ